ncbi:hypothetical protein L596_008420 [Steinernema carpocapsae]|uniref:Uncharacterized protein n=1 Tax=Steinernema carpocapsae TaxID=34508 RepID=A0A4V6A6D0_STECR|nr:hypothetical protein L596_008420 [Steinernema carpocapsae]
MSSTSCQESTTSASQQSSTSASSTSETANSGQDQRDDDTEGDGTPSLSSSTSKPEYTPTDAPAKVKKSKKVVEVPEKKKEKTPKKEKESPAKTELKPAFASKPRSPRMLILMRNGEQMDKVFPEWMTKNFVNKKYVSSDMNQPVSLPHRRDPLTTYRVDPPLTEMGLRTADLIGKALFEQGIVISSVYSSPSLRCIQTAHRLIKPQLYDLKIRVEPALYDFVGTTDTVLPTFMTLPELSANSIPVDNSYRPIVPVSNLKNYVAESSNDFFKRSAEVGYNLVKFQSPSGTALVITHACTMHAIGRGLTGFSTYQSSEEMKRVPSTIHSAPT